MFDFRITPTGATIRRLTALNMSDSQKAKLGRLIGAEMVHRTEERFATQRAPNGSPWLPSKRAIEQGGQTLRDKGRLLASLTYTVVPKGVEWGSNVVYAAMMNFGGKKSQFSNLWGDIPARTFMGINDDDASEIKRIITGVLQE